MSLLKTWLAIEESYSKLLAKRVRTALAAVMPDLIDKAASDPEAAVRMLEDLVFEAPTAAELKQAQLIGLTALQFGTSTIRKRATKRWLEKDANLNMLDAGTAQLFVCEGVSIPKMLALQLRLAMGIDTPVEKADADDAAGAGGTPGWVPLLDDAVEDSTRLISNLTTSRLVNYGALVQIRADRVTEYGLKITMDGKTSKVCRELNRKKPRFKVADGIETLERALMAQSPDELKLIQPWIPNTAAVLEELRNMPAPTLRNRGWHIPPFHPHCRTIAVKIRQRTTVDAQVIG